MERKPWTYVHSGWRCQLDPYSSQQGGYHTDNTRYWHTPLMILPICALAFVLAPSYPCSRSRDAYMRSPPRIHRPKPVLATDIPLYLPLDTAKDTVRLLLVHSGQRGDEIKCSLVEVPLNNNPEYAALSYTWGAPIRRSASRWTLRGMYQYLREKHEQIFLPRTSTITLDGYPVPVTNNLESALQHLRRPNEPLLIWVDAVCINQGDDAEKAHEVSLMHGIYRKAKTTYVWLGPSADDSNTAMDFVRETTSLDVMSPDFRLDKITPFPPWNALQALFARSWWSRVWVIQEACLSRDVIVKCGEKEVPLGCFTHLAVNENKIRRRLRTDAAFGGKYARMVRWTFIPPTTPFYLLLGTWSDMHALTLNSGIPLWGGLTMTSLFHATMPRDKVYGVLGLVLKPDRDAIDVDYTSRKSDTEVFKDVIAYIIKSEKHLEPLQMVGPQKQLPGLPSWVPDLSYPSTWFSNTFLNVGYSAGGTNLLWLRLNHPYLGAFALDHPIFMKIFAKFLPYANRQLIGTFSDSRGAGVSFSSDQAILTVRGIPIDTIAIADAAPPTNIFHASDHVYLNQSGVWMNPELAPATRKWERLAAAYPQKPYGSSGACYNAFWRMIITNRYRGGSDGAVAAGGFIAPPAHYHLAYELWTGQRSPPRDPKEYARLSLLVGTFQAMVGRVAESRAFIITKGGWYGMAPNTSRPGDLVCVLQHGQVPFVLRQINKEGLWELVGECYVHGFMQSEAVTRAHTEDVKLFSIA